MSGEETMWLTPHLRGCGLKEREGEQLPSYDNDMTQCDVIKKLHSKTGKKLPLLTSTVYVL